MSASAVVSAPPLEAPAAAHLSLGPTAALLFAARCLQYIVAGLTGVIIARTPGPDGSDTVRTRPIDGRKLLYGSSAAMRHSIAQPLGTMSACR